MKQIAVLGLGRFGSSLARTLMQLGHDVLGVDSNAKIVEAMSEELTTCAQANVEDERALKALGLSNFDVVVISIAETQPCIIATMLLKEMGVKTVVCKANSERNAAIYSKLGADRVVFPERDMGVRLARSIANTDVLEYITLSKTHSMLEMHLPRKWVGRTIRGTHARAEYGINIVGIHRQGELMMSFTPEELLLEEDILVVIGSNEQLDIVGNL